MFPRFGNTFWQHLLATPFGNTFWQHLLTNILIPTLATKQHKTQIQNKKIKKIICTKKHILFFHTQNQNHKTTKPKPQNHKTKTTKPKPQNQNHKTKTTKPKPKF